MGLTKMKWPNPLGIAGGLLAFLSLALPWLFIRANVSILGLGAGGSLEVNLFGLANLIRSLEQLAGAGQLAGSDVSDALGFIYLIIVLVALGGIISLIHPLGGILQTLGALIFAAASGVQASGSITGVGSIEVGYGAGFYLALLSGMLALAGLAWHVPRVAPAQPPVPRPAFQPVAQPTIYQPPFQRLPPAPYPQGQVVNPPARAYQAPADNPAGLGSAQEPPPMQRMGPQVPRNFCLKCGAPLPTGSAFCGACGTKIG